MIEQTIAALKEMRMSTMAREYLHQIELPEMCELSFDERLAMMVQSESEKRADTKLKRLIRQATLSDAGANIDEIRYSKARNLKKDMTVRLSSLSWVKAPHNLIITGACGTGKSWLASAWGKYACIHGFSVKMVRLSRLSAELHVMRNELTLLKAFDKLARTDLLIIDDFGLDRLDDYACRDLLEIAESRYRERATVFTSQLPVAKWHGLFDDKTIADAFLDRLVHNSMRIELTGPSMRKEASAGTAESEGAPSD